MCTLVEVSIEEGEKSWGGDVAPQEVEEAFSRVGSRSENHGCRIDCLSSRIQSFRQRALDSHARIFITILNISIFRCPKLLIAEAFLLKTNRSGLCLSDNKTNEV